MKTTGVSPESLSSIALFEHLDMTECGQLAEVAEIHEFAPGEMIMRQGNQSQILCAVLEGTCDVLKKHKPSDSDEEGIVLAELGPGEHFGEMSFFHAAPHSAGVRAKTAVKLLRIERQRFDKLIDGQCACAYKLAMNVVESLAERVRRMDQWVTELLCDEPQDRPSREWHHFREKLFGDWQL